MSCRDEGGQVTRRARSKQSTKQPHAQLPAAPGWAAPAPPQADSPRRGLSVGLALFWMETIAWLYLVQKKTGDFHAILLLQYFPFVEFFSPFYYNRDIQGPGWRFECHV